MKKTTEELKNEIINSKEISNYIKKNERELLNMSLSNYLKSMLEKYQTDKSKVLARAEMTANNYGYELFRDDTKKASRDKIIQICMGFPLTVEETQQALKYGHASALYPRDKRDSVIMFALAKQMTVSKLNEVLDEQKEKLIL